MHHTRDIFRYEPREAKTTAAAHQIVAGPVWLIGRLFALQRGCCGEILSTGLAAGSLSG